MKTITYRLLILFITFTVIFSSCKKADTTTGNNPYGYLAPTLAKDTLINLPPQIQTKATSYSSQGDTLGGTLYTLVEFAALVNAYSTGLSGAFLISPSIFPGYTSKTNSNGSVTYSYNLSAYGVNEGISLTYYKSSSESWWEYSVDSASSSKELYYIDDKGTSGTIDWYNASSIKGAQELALSDTWSVSGGTTNSTFSLYNNDGSLNEQFISTSASNKSGTLTVTGQNNNTGPLLKQWYFSWTSTGTGTYIEYDTSGSIAISQGAF